MRESMFHGPVGPEELTVGDDLGNLMQNYMWAGFYHA